jgi:hypothetical protein
VTFRLQPGNRLQLVLHRGAAVRDDAADFRFEDPSGLLEWAAPDRAVISFRDFGPVQGTAASVRGVGRTGSFR